MDPITAVGFAASILTFIDFSWSVVTGTYEVYKSASGTTRDNAHISTVIDDLERVTEGLISDIGGKTKNERELCKLADKCHDLSEDLSKILRKLQVSEKNSKWQSFKVKVASMRKEKEIASIEDRLDRYRSQILVRLNFMLSEQQSSVKVQLDKIQEEGAKMSSETAIQFVALRKELNEAVKALLATKDVLLEAKDEAESTMKSTRSEEKLQISTEICTALSKLQLVSKSLSQETRILRRLYFDDMYTREDSVVDAEIGTFKWILEEDKDEDESVSSSEQDVESELYKDLSNADERFRQEIRARTQGSFLTWLKSGSQIYHISGKAGSGKSTLMKFLCHHPRVRKELESWAAEKTLIFAQFYFWSSGEKLQASLEGLYRSLLFETLKQCPSLIPEIFPGDWDALDSTSVFDDPSFRIAEIKTAFNKLASKRDFPNHRLCFFIDGLDEYDGDSLEHWKLAESLQSWASSADIKICVSSRPHTEFMNTFSDNPNLRIHLHELTRNDITRFACAMFEKDTNFQQVSNIYMDLVYDVVRMADGVFLWARLVVRSLLEGVGHQDSSSTLREKLSAIPKDLDEMFTKLLSSIHPSDRKRSDQIFLLATGDGPQANLNSMAFSWLEDLNDPEFPCNSPTRGYSDEEIQTRHRKLRPQLNSLTKGLLEMVPDDRYIFNDIFFGYTVQFFHRTVKDYLCDDARQNQLQNRLPNFNFNEVCSRLCLAELKFARTRESYFSYSFSSGYNPLYQALNCSGRWHFFKFTAGQKTPFNFVEEVSAIINCYRQLPFSHPKAESKNFGLIEWGEVLKHKQDSVHSYPVFSNSREDFSYPHWAAAQGQYQYFSQSSLGSIIRVGRNNELSYLLSATIGHNLKLVQFLFRSGADPEEGISLSGKNISGMKKTTTWMVFLFHFAISILGTVLDRSFRTSYFLLLEEYLKFGAENNVIFLVKLRPGLSVIRKDDFRSIEQNTRVSAENTQELESELFSVSLEEFIRLYQPENIDALQALLLKKSSFWGKPGSTISRFLLWGRPSTTIKSEYKPFRFKELGDNKFILQSIVSKDRELTSGFEVRVW